MFIGLNWVDLALLLFLVGGLILGFTRGLIWELVGLAALYIGAVIASQYYYLLTNFLRQLAGNSSSPRLMTSIAFLFLLFLVALIINWVAMDALRNMRLKVFSSLDHLGGTVFGLIGVTALIIILAPVTIFAINEPWPIGWPENLRAILEEQFKHSGMLLVINALKPVMLESIKPWLPSGLPSVFNL